MQWEITQEIDIKHGAQGMQSLQNALMVAGDNEAHIWKVSLLDNGVAASVTGTIIGYFARPDNQTVMVEGVLEGNIASVVLPQAVYAKAGNVQAIMRLSDAEGRVVTLSALIMPVRQVVTDSVVDPGVVIPSLDDLLAQIAAMEEATARANAAGLNFRGDYTPDADPLYAKRDMVFFNGGSYGYSHDTPSNEIPTSKTHWQQIATMGGQDLVDAAVAARDAAKGYKDAAAAYAAQLAAGLLRPKGTYDNLAALNAGTPTVADTNEIYITLDDGKWCYHNGTAWVAGGQFQAIAIADGSVTSDKIAADTLRSANINDSVASVYTYRLDGTKSAAQENPDEPLYICYAFDTLVRSFGDEETVEIVVDYDATSLSDNINEIALKLFSGDDIAFPLPWSLIVNGRNASIIDPVVGTKNHRSFTHSGVIGAVRYLKVYVAAYLTDGTLPGVYECNHLKMTINGNEYPLAQVKSLSTASSVVKLLNTKNLIPYGYGETTYAKVSDVLLTNRWKGKKANFLGDSITWGQSGGSVVTTPYHQWIKSLLGMTLARNYGINGTHISGNYVDDGNSGNPAQSMSVRFSAMDNDADLVVVLGGTNDWGHAATAPFGSFSDATDVSYYGALHVLISGLIKKYLGKTIVIMTPLRRTGGTNASTWPYCQTQPACHG